MEYSRNKDTSMASRTFLSSHAAFGVLVTCFDLEESYFFMLDLCQFVSVSYKKEKSSLLFAVNASLTGW